MNKNKVVLHIMNQTTTFLETDAFRFVPKGKFIRLKQYLWSMFLKLDCLESHFDKNIKMDKIVIDKLGFADKMIALYDNFIKRGIVPKHVYMGWDEFHKLADYNYKNGYSPYIDFTVEMEYDGRLFNLHVTIIDYMEGILFV